MSIGTSLHRNDTDPARSFLLLAFFMICGAVWFLLGTRHGIGILPDSTRYMQISPVPYDAPLYAWLLLLGTGLGFSLDGFARAVAFVFDTANIVLMFVILRIAIPKNLPLLALSMILVVLAPQFIRAHIVAMSEPLFICLTLSCILLLVKYIETERTGFLAATGVVLGLAMLARFTAAPYGVAFAASLLLCSGKWTLRRRIRDVFLLGATSGGIFLAWAIGSKLLVGRAIGRSFAFYGNADPARWLSGLDSLSAFLLPTAVPAAIRYVLAIAILALVVALGVRAWRRVQTSKSPSRSDILTMVLGLVVFWYMAFMVLAVNIEANLPINGRYLLPVYLAIVAILFSGLAGLQTGRRMSAVGYAALLLIVAAIASDTARSVNLTYAAFHEGMGYQGPGWRQSPIVLALDELPADAEIFTNAPDALNYLTGRHTKLIPTRVERRTGVEDPANSYRKQVKALKDRLQRGNAYVVFVDKVNWRFYLAAEEKLRADAGLLIERAEPDGRIYDAR